VVPNEELLRQARLQTRTRQEDGWQEAVARRATGLDLAAIRADVEPFLECREELVLFTHENILSVLEG